MLSGGVNPNMTQLEQKNICNDAFTVTSVELVKYIRENYPDFVLGAAFNPL